VEKPTGCPTDSIENAAGEAQEDTTNFPNLQTAQ
jgi:hypothetical protein